MYSVLQNFNLKFLDMNLKQAFKNFAKKYRNQRSINDDSLHLPPYLQRQVLDKEKLEAEKRHIDMFTFLN